MTIVSYHGQSYVSRGEFYDNMMLLVFGISLVIGEWCSEPRYILTLLHRYMYVYLPRYQ